MALPPRDAITERRRGWRERLLSPWLLLTLTALFWSGNFIVGRAVHATLDPWLLALGRWWLALLIILPFAIGHLRHDWPEVRLHAPILLLLAWLSVANFNTLIYLGLQTTSATNAVLLQSAIPIAILILAASLLRERISVRQIGGILLSLCGVVVIISHGDISRIGRLAFGRGDLLIVAAVVSWALYSVLLRYRPAAIHPLTFLLLTILLGLAILTPIALWQATWQASYLRLGHLAAIAYVALFSSILAYLFWNRAVAEVGASRAGQFIHLMPLFGAGLAILFLDERPQLYHLAGLLLILGGITVALAQRRRD
jgi:drug/metabolite transporter (DMT)-like permease